MFLDELAKHKARCQRDYAKKEGIEQGTLKGIEDTKVEMIKNMLNENTDYDFISKISGKTVDEIIEIEKNMKL